MHNDVPAGASSEKMKAKKVNNVQTGFICGSLVAK